MTVAVNPHEGQVAIPHAGGLVAGRLSARAMAWVEEATGKKIIDIWGAFFARVGTLLPVGDVATVLWAAMEDERRRQPATGAEFTIDDGYAIVDEIGLDEACARVFLLLSLSAALRKERGEIVDKAAEQGVDVLDPLVAAARTWPVSLPPASEPASPTVTPGA